MKKIVVFVMLMIASAIPAYAQQQQSATPPLVAADLFSKASASITAQNYTQASLDLSLFILLNPTYSPGYYERAQSYMALNDFDHALEDVDHAIDTAASVASADYGSALYVMRGQIDGQKQNLPDALKDYTQAITLKPTLQALAGRGLLYLGQSNYQLALTDLNSAISLDASNPVLFVYRGAANLGLHDAKSAGADYLSFFKAIQPNPTAHAPIQSGQAVTLQIDQGVVIGLPFTAKAKQYISALAVARSGTVDPLLVLVDPQGNPLAGDDDSGGNSNALILNYQVAADGDYTLVVGHSLGGYTGTVLLQFQVSDTPAQ